MPSTTPAPERAPRCTGTEGPARRAAGEPMRALLAACAAAEAVSTPPGRRPAGHAGDGPADGSAHGTGAAHEPRRAA
ncbi:hypothetical protein ACFCX4_23210 [Kitasatospora sp. NPDC056327]|uniref:hypothetical protein n=1 Tax=Kitasatospora sp. NPDC056327 TaxID=3345785 RepID=UPI0035DDA5E6